MRIKCLIVVAWFVLPAALAACGDPKPLPDKIDASPGCECEADSGPCCDGCNYYVPGDQHVCDEETEYSCEDDNCGTDARIRNQTWYCAGGTSDCSGEPESNGWETHEPCGADERCVTDGTSFAGCQGAVDCMGNEWVALFTGSYQMGSAPELGFDDEQPQREVTLSAFELLKTEVTVAQYGKCVDEGDCTEPDTGAGCNWGVTGLEDHPLNCVGWQQAADFCDWAGGALPTEAQWEYAARSGGQETTYPWGEEDDPPCDYAVVEDGTAGCGEESTWEPCGIEAGDSEQGACDLTGNVWEWVLDWYSCSYGEEELELDAGVEDAGVDGGTDDICTSYGGPCGPDCWVDDPAGPCGGADPCPGRTDRVLRGGSFRHEISSGRAANRFHTLPSYALDDVGLRCARQSD